MKKGHKQCKDCLAYYDVHHTCDGLMKALVQAHKRHGKKLTNLPISLHSKEDINIPHSSNGTWEKLTDSLDIQTHDALRKLMHMNMENVSTVMSMIKDRENRILSSERTSMIGEVEKWKIDTSLPQNAYNLIVNEGTDVGGQVYGFNQALDQVINYLKNK